MVWPFLIALGKAAALSAASAAAGNIGSKLFANKDQQQQQGFNPMQSGLQMLGQPNFQGLFQRIYDEERQKNQKYKRPVPLMDMPNLYQPWSPSSPFQNSSNTYQAGGLYGGR